MMPKIESRISGDHELRNHEKRGSSPVQSFEYDLSLMAQPRGLKAFTCYLLFSCGKNVESNMTFQPNLPIESKVVLEVA